MLTEQLRPDEGDARFKGPCVSGLSPHAVWQRGISHTFPITATFASLGALEKVQVARFSCRRRTGRAEAVEADAARHPSGLGSHR